MIYEEVAETAPHRQGDIWRAIPKLDFELDKMPVRFPNEVSPRTRSWDDLKEKGDTATATVAVRPVCAIVGSQDCDCVRSEYLTLFEIRGLYEVVKMTEPGSDSGWTRFYKTQLDQNPKWFYLPEDDDFGFERKMAVDFTVALRVRRANLDSRRKDRIGRLRPVADEHFRERLSHFFQRYPVNAWYPLAHHEAVHWFKTDNGLPEPVYEWQKPDEAPPEDPNTTE